MKAVGDFGVQGRPDPDVVRRIAEQHKSDWVLVTMDLSIDAAGLKCADLVDAMGPAFTGIAATSSSQALSDAGSGGGHGEVLLWVSN